MLQNEDGRWTRDGRLVVPENSEIRRDLVAAHHDHALAGHPGIANTLKAVAEGYWWLGLREFVTAYVKGCATCQSTKLGTN